MSAVPRLDATLAWLRERTEEANARLRQSETQNVCNVVQLPLWPEPVRAVPNGFLRSALFGVVKKGARRYVEREQIAAVDGVQILYTGQRLDQADLDVYVSVLHAVRLQALGSQCRITSYALLKSPRKASSIEPPITAKMLFQSVVASRAAQVLAWAVPTPMMR